MTKKRWLALALAAGLVLAVLAGCTVQSKEKVDLPSAAATTPSASTQEAPQEPSEEPSTEPSQEPSEEPQKAKEGYGVGEEAQVGDISVTLTEVEESAGSALFTPEDGKVYLICHFDLANNSDEDLAVSSLLSFDAYVDDYSTSVSLSATVSSDGTQLDGTVAAGKKLAGVIGYEVDKDWSTLEITFTPNIWSGDKVTFVAEKG